MNSNINLGRKKKHFSEAALKVRMTGNFHVSKVHLSHPTKKEVSAQAGYQTLINQIHATHFPHYNGTKTHKRKQKTQMSTQLSLLTINNYQKCTAIKNNLPL